MREWLMSVAYLCNAAKTTAGKYLLNEKTMHKQKQTEIIEQTVLSKF